MAYYFYMRYVLGFDGGGTKTECVLMDEEKNVVAPGRAGASNPVRVGFERAVAMIGQAAKSAMLEAGLERDAIAALCAAIAGAGDTQLAESLRAGLAAVFPGMAMKICTDLDILLAAAGEGPVMVLIAGTGSAAAARTATGEMRRAGGLGPRTGDQGSAGDTGKKAVMAAKLHRERTGVESWLGKQMLNQLGISNWTELPGVGNSSLGSVRASSGGRSGDVPQDLYPRLFPMVANAADAGDEMAQELLRNAAGDLAALVKQLVDELHWSEVPFPLAKTGGTIGRSAYFDVELEKRLREAAPKATIGLPAISPAHAAALMALELIPGRGLTRHSNV
jgi:N-acetylglucosamine kinase-like BadF-type ATPase